MLRPSIPEGEESGPRRGFFPSAVPAEMPPAAGDEDDAVHRVLQDHDLLACVLQHLSPHSLAAACGAAPRLRTIGVNTVVPPRLDEARNRAKSFGYTIKDLAPGMSAVEYLFQAEGAAEAAESSAKKRAEGKRKSLPNYCDHIRVEAAMRQRLDEFEPRIEAIEARITSLASDNEIEQLHDEAHDLENEIFLGQSAATGMPPGLSAQLALMGLAGGVQAAAAAQPAAAQAAAMASLLQSGPAPGAPIPEGLFALLGHGLINPGTIPASEPMQSQQAGVERGQSSS